MDENLQLVCSVSLRKSNIIVSASYKAKLASIEMLMDKMDF